MTQEISIEDVRELIGIDEDRGCEIAEELFKTTRLGKLLLKGVDNTGLAELMSKGVDNIVEKYDKDSMCAGVLYCGMFITAMGQEEEE